MKKKRATTAPPGLKSTSLRGASPSAVSRACSASNIAHRDGKMAVAVAQIVGLGAVLVDGQFQLELGFGVRQVDQREAVENPAGPRPSARRPSDRTPPSAPRPARGSSNVWPWPCGPPASRRLHGTRLGDQFADGVVAAYYSRIFRSTPPAMPGARACPGIWSNSAQMDGAGTAQERGEIRASPCCCSTSE